MEDSRSTMKCVLLLLAVACAHGAPANTTPPSSCRDALANGAAAQAIDKINLERSEGYVFNMERLSNVHQMRHGENGVVYYLTIDVLETKCHVLSKKNWRNCGVRDIGENPVYGQCKAVIYINRVHRVSRLYKYSCGVRPVPASKIASVCPDCPVLFPLDNEEVQKTMKLGMEKFNKEYMPANYFIPLNITRAVSQGGIMTFYKVEFTIQETVCSNKTDLAQISKCDIMVCEFAHKGLCKASLSRSNGNEHLSVECEIFEPEAAEEEKKRHLLGGELDHSHSNIGDKSLGHDHTHDHTSPHSHSHSHDHDHTHNHKTSDGHDHTKDSGHHHTHEHSEGHGHSHSHAHSHDHGHDHDHGHAHHTKAHNHTEDQGQHPHHNYGHGKEDTHEHDHEMALDHEHKHAHLHEHEHHHHHHEHQHDTPTKRPEGVVYVLPSMDKPMTLPAFPLEPVADPAKPTTLALHPDPQIPGEREPTIKPFPTGLSKDCPADFRTENNLIKEVFAQDPLFKSVS